MHHLSYPYSPHTQRRDHEVGLLRAGPGRQRHRVPRVRPPCKCLVGCKTGGQISFLFWLAFADALPTQTKNAFSPSSLLFLSLSTQGFTNNPKPETLDWYRAAELKHGRVAMLAALGQITQHFYTLPDESGVFSAGDRPFEALNKVVAERPLAAIQIGLAIFAVEALGQFNQAKPGQAPGDLGWDPLNLKSDDPEIYEKVQKRELKNGRLAMVCSC